MNSTLSLNIIDNSDSENIMFVDEFTRAVGFELQKISKFSSKIVYFTDLNGNYKADMIKLVEMYNKQDDTNNCILCCIEASDSVFVNQGVNKDSEESVKYHAIRQYLFDTFKYLTDIGFINIDYSLFSACKIPDNTLFFVYGNSKGISLINHFKYKYSEVIDQVINTANISDDQIQANHINHDDEDYHVEGYFTEDIKPAAEESLMPKEENHDMAIEIKESKDRDTLKKNQNISPVNNFRRMVDEVIKLNEPYKSDNDGK